VFLISDLLDADWASSLHLLGARNQGDVILHVLAPDEWDPPLGDEVELQDSETGELRQTRFGPNECREYRSRLQVLVSDIDRLSRRLDLRYLSLNTGEPLATTLLQRLPAAGVLQ
jgi:hypothetical protein